MRTETRFAVATLACLAAIGCQSGQEAGWVPWLAPQTATAYVVVDTQGEPRQIATVAGSARKFRLRVTDSYGFIVGGADAFGDLPANNAVAIPGLPANTTLRFNLELQDGSGNQVGLTKKQLALPPGQVTGVRLHVYFETTEPTDEHPAQGTSAAGSNTVSLRVTLTDGKFFIVVPSVSAVDAGGSPVACNPTYSISGSYEGTYDMGADPLPPPHAILGNGNMFSTQAIFTENCGTAAVTITRALLIRRVAKAAVSVD